MEQLKKVRFGSVADCIVLSWAGGYCHQHPHTNPPRVHGTGAHQPHVNESTARRVPRVLRDRHSLNPRPAARRSKPRLVDREGHLVEQTLVARGSVHPTLSSARSSRGSRSFEACKAAPAVCRRALHRSALLLRAPLSRDQSDRPWRCLRLLLLLLPVAPPAPLTPLPGEAGGRRHRQAAPYGGIRQGWNLRAGGM